jgi:hypothetical protein
VVSETEQEPVRTTLTIDDGIAQELKKLAHDSGRSFKSVVNETLRRGLSENAVREQPRPYRLRAVSMGPVREGIDINRALALADRLEDEELLRKLTQRK